MTLSVELSTNEGEPTSGGQKQWHHFSICTSSQVIAVESVRVNSYIQDGKHEPDIPLNERSISNSSARVVRKALSKRLSKGLSILSPLLSPLLSLFILISIDLNAQPFTRQTSVIPFTANGKSLPFPFAGGMNTPNAQFVDIDGDGDYDVFIFDRDLSVEFYRNTGTAQAPKFINETGQVILPKFYSWFRFVDIDGDGDFDLYTDDGGYGVMMYENVGSAQSPNFTLSEASVLDIVGTKVYSERSSVPAFGDIDGDGDLDFFSVNASNGTINFYENVGTPFAPAFKFITDKFQDIQIISGGVTPPGPNGSRPMHGVAAMMLADIDGNKTLDLIYGDLFALSIWLFRNDGTPQSPKLVKAADHFPPGAPVTTSGFNMPTLVDIDGDGLPDLFVGVLSSFAGTRNFMFYKNVGTATSPSFSPVTEDYLPMFDVGTNSHPAFVDLDSDGDLDLVVGNLEGNITYAKNTGSKTSPAFTLIDTLFAGVTGDYSYAPSFADIDGDGAQDMIVGMYSGHILYYKNTGNAASPQFQFSSSQLDTMRFGAFCSPVLADMDGDGLVDLVVGKGTGKLSYFRNTGTKNAFSFSLVTDYLDSIAVGQNAQPFFVDYDGDGDLDLFIGSTEGNIQFFRNTGTKSSPHFVRETNNFFPGVIVTEAVPALVDIDGDGDLDLFVGNSKGGLYFFRNGAITGVKERPTSAPIGFTLGQNYPNPFNPSTRLQFTIPARPAGGGNLQFVELKIFDLLGREVATLVNEQKSPGMYTVDWDADGFPSGVYFYRLNAGKFSETKKMVLMR